MKKYIQTLLPSLLLILAVSCNTPPEKYFDIAILNCNTIAGFGGSLDRSLESPSVKLVAGTKDQTETMKRAEVMSDQIHYVEENLSDIRDLKKTDDTKDILESSIALHEFILPIYKNEYTQLARLYDDNASKEQIEAQKQDIFNKYAMEFGKRYDAVTKAGKAYATKHGIKVNWDIHTSPQ